MAYGGIDGFIFFISEDKVVYYESYFGGPSSSTTSPFLRQSPRHHRSPAPILRLGTAPSRIIFPFHLPLIRHLSLNYVYRPFTIHNSFEPPYHHISDIDTTLSAHLSTVSFAYDNVRTFNLKVLRSEGRNEYEK